jgi:hypothetical protein
VSDTTPAETIRRAASLMRERAEAATEGPWHPVAGIWGDEIATAVIARALAVADLLEEIARQYDAPPCDSPAGVCNGCERREDFNDALRLAQAYLGETS